MRVSASLSVPACVRHSAIAQDNDQNLGEFFVIISEDQKRIAEEEIRNIYNLVDYQIREYPVEVIVGKYLEKQEDGMNEIFVPEYQRDLVWDDKRQSKFIESLLIGLPIPYLFVADVGNENADLEGRLEIVDGTQRVRTLARFLTDALKLSDLEKLPSLDGFRFSDLPPSRQRRFSRITLRMIELTEKADEETRRDMFDRINTGAVRLNDMESRRGRLPGPFIDLVKALAGNSDFKVLTPISLAQEKRYEREELVARFFTFFDQLDDFGKTDAGKVVSDFVDDYVTKMNELMSVEAAEGKATTRDRLLVAWENMLSFVKANFKNGFAKSAKAKSTPRVRFDAIAVGVALALVEKADLYSDEIPMWIESEEFKKQTTSDAANNRSRVLGRILFVKGQLLK
ncbi:DUF262 domain-containing protein [Rhizobium leguminosarum]|nr:DUF262 domain-containing protein [Rhizobium ruizarguesonis]TBB95745.1 DUF262 domain-containing protein [Rhizobium ruizarguesonis]